MTQLAPTPRRRRDLARTIGATMTSCAGAGSAATIFSFHGSSPDAFIVLGSMQIWAILELIFRWQVKWRYSRLFEAIAQKAAENPSNAELRTLLVDIASTHIDELGERLPVRKDLKLLFAGMPQRCEHNILLLSEAARYPACLCRA
jgi:hypothetical protein